MFFTIITEKRVIRVKGRSVQQVTQALNEVGIEFIGLHQDSE